MIEVNYLQRCIKTLDKAFELLQLHSESSIEYDLYRAACSKEFELILEQSGKLLKKALTSFVMSKTELDRLPFKDVFRKASKHGLLDIQATERWLTYRDIRNATAHEIDANFAEVVLKHLPQFILDAKELSNTIERLHP